MQAHTGEFGEHYTEIRTKGCTEEGVLLLPGLLESIHRGGTFALSFKG